MFKRKGCHEKDVKGCSKEKDVKGCSKEKNVKGCSKEKDVTKRMECVESAQGDFKMFSGDSSAPEYRDVCTNSRYCLAKEKTQTQCKGEDANTMQRRRLKLNAKEKTQTQRKGEDSNTTQRRRLKHFLLTVHENMHENIEM